MEFFDSTQKHVINQLFPEFKHPIPIVYYLPDMPLNAQTPIVFFVSGIKGTIPGTDLLKHPFYNDKILVSYEKKDHGNNHNPASRFWQNYVKELAVVINFVKQLFPHRKLFLLGESWGAGLSFLYYISHLDQVDGIVGWNMPRFVKDVTDAPFAKKFDLGWKMVLILLFGVTNYNYNPIPSIDKISSNKKLIRIRNLNKELKENNKSSFVCWRTFPHSWHALRELLIKHNDSNFLYVQSGQDALADYPFWNKFKAAFPNNPHLVNFADGYHILSQEEPLNDALYCLCQKLIDKN